jgi:hypothetical protein
VVEVKYFLKNDSKCFAIWKICLPLHSLSEVVHAGVATPGKKEDGNDQKTVW